MKTIFKLCIIAGFGFIASCANDSVEELHPKPVETSSCDTTDVKFSEEISAILNGNCVSCHTGATPPANVTLDNYDGVRAVALSGQLHGVTHHLPGYPQMPQGGTKLDSCKLAQIDKWISNGSQNN